LWHFALLTCYICTSTTRVARRVSLVEQEIRILPEHLSPFTIFSGDCVAQASFFCIVFCRTLFVLLLLSTVLSDLLRFTTSDYPLWYLKTCLMMSLLCLCYSITRMYIMSQHGCCIPFVEHMRHLSRRKPHIYIYNKGSGCSRVV
jgi:hypothetical protein